MADLRAMADLLNSLQMTALYDRVCERRPYPYRRVLRSVKQVKLTVSSGVTSWKLDANLSSSPACVVDIPQKPFQDSTPWVPVRFEPTEFRTIFSDRIWKQKLLPESVNESFTSARTRYV